MEVEGAETRGGGVGWGCDGRTGPAGSSDGPRTLAHGGGDPRIQKGGGWASSSRRNPLGSWEFCCTRRLRLLSVAFCPDHLFRLFPRKAVDHARGIGRPVLDVRKQVGDGALAAGRLAHHGVGQIWPPEQLAHVDLAGGGGGGGERCERHVFPQGAKGAQARRTVPLGSPDRALDIPKGRGGDDRSRRTHLIDQAQMGLRKQVVPG
eukprot:scaffold5041_cov107-Isochrysis_galbana.AAC.5